MKLITRRAVAAAALGAAAGGLPGRPGRAQSTGHPPSGQHSPGTDSLQNRGAPRGRIGAATRDASFADGVLALDLAAPLRGVGLTSDDRPTLYYLLSGRVARPLRLTVSLPRQPRPVADLDLARPQHPGLGVVRLGDHKVRLSAGLHHVWSVALPLDPKDPSRDLVASALIEYRPRDPALDKAVREAAPGRSHAVLVQAGYWYDAFALAVQERDRGRDAALSELLGQAELRVAATPPPAPTARR